MLRNKVFALASVLMLGVGAAACGDDPGEGGTTQPPTEPGSGRQAYSYIAGLSIPEEGSDDCCADLNGDGEMDNTLADLLPTILDLIPSDDPVNLDELIGGIFEEGSLTLLFHHDSPPEDITGAGGAYHLNLHLGESESDWAARSSGNGVFTLGDKLVTVPNAVIRRSTLSAKMDKLPLSLDISSFLGEDDDLGLPSTLGITLSALSIDLAITETQENRIGTANVTEAAGKPTNYLTGALGFGEVAALVNLVLDCGDGPLIRYEETSSGVELSCDPAVEASVPEDAEGLCGYVGMVCGLAGTLVTILEPDVDTNDNGVYDGVSLGFRIKLAGAALAE